MDKLIKSIETNKYLIELVENENSYRIYYSSIEGVGMSEMIIEFHTASYIFDYKVQELEGH